MVHKILFNTYVAKSVNDWDIDVLMKNRTSPNSGIIYG